MIAHSMKSKERPWALTKECPIHEVKKDYEDPKVPKRRKKKEIIIIIIIKKKEEDLGQAKGRAVRRRIPVELENMQQE